MALLVAKCAECGFENPRRWIACARCGHLLGPTRGHNARAGQTITQRADTLVREGLPELAHDTSVKTSVSAAPLEQFVEPEPTSATQLLRTADARPLVGREEAIVLLRRNLERAFGEQRVTLTIIHGATGTGRTRMLELASELAARQWLNTRVLYAGCRNDDDGPYAPFSRLLLERFGVTPASSPSQVRADMFSAVSHILDGGDAHELHALTQLLGHVAGVPFPGSALLAALNQAPEELHTRAYHALAQLFEGEARTRPLLLLLDDMQRAQSAVFDVVLKLTAAFKPIAVVVAGDSSLAPALAEFSELVPTQMIELEPLSASEVAALARALLPDLNMTPQLIAALCERSRGNPAWVRELVRGLENPEFGLPAAHAAPPQTDHDAMDPVLRLHVSDHLHVRLSALQPFDRALLEWAAVIGERFWESALLALARSHAPTAAPELDPLLRWDSARDEQQLREALGELLRVGLIARSAEPGHGSAFTFAHPQTRALVYAELPHDARVRGHAAVARWLSLTQALPRDGRKVALAYHHEQAGHRAQAAQAYLSAAQQERAQLRTSSALAYAQKAAALAEPCEPTTQLISLYEVGSLLTTLSHYESASAVFCELLELAWQLGARSMGATALNGLAKIHRLRAEHARAFEHHQRALQLFQGEGDAAGSAATYDEMAHTHRARGDLDAAFDAAQRALAQRRELGDARSQAVSLTTLGFIELDRGHLPASKAHFSAAQSQADPELLLQIEIGLGKLAHHEGELANASRRYALALSRARTLNDRRMQCLLLNAMAETQLALNRTDQALELLMRARTQALELRDHSALTEIQQNLALVALARNEPSAEAQLTVALQAAREHGTREAVAQAYRGLARMHARMRHERGPDVGDAEASFRESIRIFEESGNLREAACTRAELGFYLVERGAGARARAALGEAYAALKPLCLPELERVTETLEQLGA